MKTAVIGASGFIGRHLWQAYRRQYPDCVGTGCSRTAEGLTPFDLRRPDLSALRLEESGHQAVVIASAITNVGYCEQHPRESHEVNVRGTLELLHQIGRTSLQAIFLSSDYVFDGVTGGYSDEAAPNPTTEYGRQKAEIERQIGSLVENYLVVRLSRVYGLQPNDGTLLTEISAALLAGREVAAASDQRFCPTVISDWVPAFQLVQQQSWQGVVNLCSPEDWSRWEIAEALAVALRVDKSLVKNIRLHDYPGMQQRPLNTTLVCDRFRSAIEFRFQPLPESIAAWLKITSPGSAGEVGLSGPGEGS